MYLTQKQEWGGKCFDCYRSNTGTVEHERGDVTQRNETMYERYIVLVDSFYNDNFKGVNKKFVEHNEGSLEAHTWTSHWRETVEQVHCHQKRTTMMHTSIKTNNCNTCSGRHFCDVHRDWLLTCFREVGARAVCVIGL